MTTSHIHSFQSLGGVDGPGLRYVIFMQGCPLRCVYCHNPDTWEPTGGKVCTVDEVRAKILRCKPYFKRGGGVTVSGGEPLLQAGFVGELFDRLRDDGIHRALDTSGMVAGEDAYALIPKCSLILLDIKFTDGEKMKRYCGGSIDNLRRFLDKTAEANIPVITRTVIVPNLNDGEGDIEALAEFTRGYSNIEGRELLPFRRYCVEKYRSMGIPFPLEDTPDAPSETMEMLRRHLADCT